MRSERCQRRMYGDQIRPHNGAGFFRSRGIYVHGSVCGNVHHRRPKARVTGYVGAVGVDPLFR